uniref:BTB domain-containing protein n=1 Tax=Panagrolaimus davidi TaxID=227884 RepID=A0A914PA54_9BILA
MGSNQNIETLLYSVPTLDLAFRQLSELDIFPDCTLICSDNIKIQAHRRYLCTNSTHFESEFGSEIKKREQINIDATSNIVIKLLDFLYTFTTDQFQPITDTKELLRLSNMYNLAQLKARVSGILIGSFTASNVCELCNFATLHESQLIRRAAARFIASNLKEVEEITPNWKKTVGSQIVQYVQKHLYRQKYPWN